MSLEENLFISKIKNVKGHRKHKICNSYGIYDGYKYYRKNKPKDKIYILTESQYFAITRKINTILADSIASGIDVVLPYRLGRIELRKYECKITFDGKKVKSNMPIDWDRTLKLWYEDKESFKNKTLVKIEEREIYKIYYNKSIAKYNNKSFYQFNFNRELKNKLKSNIKEGIIDAFKFK
jgi:2-phosphoglycerate kinase